MTDWRKKNGRIIQGRGYRQGMEDRVMQGIPLKERGYGFLRNPLICLAVPVPPKGVPLGALTITGVGRGNPALFKICFGIIFLADQFQVDLERTADSFQPRMECPPFRNDKRKKIALFRQKYLKNQYTSVDESYD